MPERVILVHGLGSSHSRTWERYGWTDVLSGLGADPVGYELPGHGGGPAPSACRGDGIADSIVQFSRDHDARIGIGFSAGGVGLLLAAVRAPDAFDHIVLLGVGDGVWCAQDRRAALCQVLESGHAESPDDRLMLDIIADAGNDPALVAEFVRAMPPPPPLALLRRARARTLVVIGDADPNGPAEAIVQHLPNARAVCLSNTDHYRTLSAPRSFMCVEDFLKRM